MRFFISLIVILFVSISNSYASKSKDLRKIDKMYDDGLLSRAECVNSKKKTLGSNSSPTCKKVYQLKKLKNKDYSSQGTAFFIAKNLLTNYHVKKIVMLMLK